MGKGLQKPFPGDGNVLHQNPFTPQEFRDPQFPGIPGDQVQVKVLDGSPGVQAHVKTRIVPRRTVKGVQNIQGFVQRPVQGPPFRGLKFPDILYVPEGKNKQMPRIVGIQVKGNGHRIGPVYNGIRDIRYPVPQMAENASVGPFSL
jgi:hypothetical protein